MSDPQNTAAKFFVGGLAAETTEDDLRAHFEQFGELIDVAVMKDQYGVPRCFGFVQYVDENSHTCQPTGEHVISGKKVDVKAAVPKAAIDQGAPIRTNKIFVGGLSKTTTEENVRAHFGKFGNVTEVLMKLNEEGESRGFCFVEFDNEDVAEEVCNSQGQVIDDKEVECKLARPLGDKSLTNSRSAFGKGKGKGFGKGYGKGMDYGMKGGKGGAMRNDYFGGGKGAARPSPYGGAPIRSGGGKGYGGDSYGSYGGGKGGGAGWGSAAPSSYGGGKGGGAGWGSAAPAGGKGGAMVPYAAASGGKGSYGGGSTYGAAPSSSYAGYSSSYGQPASAGYGSSGYGTSAGYGAAPAAASAGYGGYSGYSAAPAATSSYGSSYGGYQGY